MSSKKNLSDAVKNQIVGMSTAGKSNREIMGATGVSRRGIQRILKKWREEGAVETKKRSGRPVSKNTPEMRDRVRKKVMRNPKRSISQLAKEESVSRDTMKRAVHMMGLVSKKPLVRHMIFPGQEAKRLERADFLLNWKVNNPNVVVLWSDEKWFYVETHVNMQNDRFLLPVGAADDDLRTIKLEKNPDKVMVFALIASDGQSMPPIIFPKGVSINKTVYKEQVLSKVIPWIKERYGPGQAVFMQNGAPAHTSNVVQKYLKDELGAAGFWDKNTWPPSR